jgi:nucleotidyltransferase/DNA polymerase involved in DNA repair
MRGVALATEDALSEAVGERLITEAGNALYVTLRLRRGGKGYLRSKLRNFCEVARHSPLLLLTDLDSARCLPALIEDWSRNNIVPDSFMFRVAVPQIESWLLADGESIANLLKVSVQRLPQDRDLLPDAKKFLLQLAKAAPRKIREELVAEQNVTAGQGLGYNKLLCDLVRSHWEPNRASSQSDSLRRTRRRLAEFAART